MKITKELQERLDREVGTYGPYGREGQARVGLDPQPLTAEQVAAVYWMEVTDDMWLLEETLCSAAEHDAEVAALMDLLNNPAYR